MISFPLVGSGRSDIYDFDGVHDPFLCLIVPGAFAFPSPTLVFCTTTLGPNVKLDMVDRTIVLWTLVNLPAHTPSQFGAGYNLFCLVFGDPICHLKPHGPTWTPMQLTLGIVVLLLHRASSGPHQ